MKFTGKVIRIGKNGKIKIPNMILKMASINKDSEAEILPFEKGILIQKHDLICLVTGEQSKHVIEVLPGIPLSPRGMEILLKEIKYNFL